MTHTYAILEVSEAVYDEIRSKLDDAGRSIAYIEGVIDMHGIALQKAKPGPACHGCDRGYSTIEIDSKLWHIDEDGNTRAPCNRSEKP